MILRCLNNDGGEAAAMGSCETKLRSTRSASVTVTSLASATEHQNVTKTD